MVKDDGGFTMSSGTNFCDYEDKKTSFSDKLLLKPSPEVFVVGRQSHFGKKRGKCCTSERFCVILLVTSLIFNAVIASVLVYRWAHRHTSDKDGQSDVISDADLSKSICMSCDSLNVPDPGNAPLMSKVKVIDGNLCCMEHSEHLQALLNLAIGQHYHYSEKGDNSDQFQIDLTTPSAHLYLHNTAPRLSDNTPENLQWDVDLGLGTAHLSGGVVYSNGSLRVPEHGLYFLYSHITFEQLTSDLTLDHDLIHSVKRTNPNLSRVSPQLLLINKMSIGGNTKRTSYLGANLMLRMDDEVFVDVSDKSLIYKFPPANFFGLYLIKRI